MAIWAGRSGEKTNPIKPNFTIPQMSGKKKGAGREGKNRSEYLFINRTMQLYDLIVRLQKMLKKMYC